MRIRGGTLRLSTLCRRGLVHDLKSGIEIENWACWANVELCGAAAVD